MKQLKITSQFKKDLKKYKNQPQRIQKLKVVLGYLEREEIIPAEYKPHKLLGNYKDCRRLNTAPPQQSSQWCCLILFKRFLHSLPPNQNLRLGIIPTDAGHAPAALLGRHGRLVVDELPETLVGLSMPLNLICRTDEIVDQNEIVHIVGRIQLETTIDLRLSTIERRRIIDHNLPS